MRPPAGRQPRLTWCAALLLAAGPACSVSGTLSDPRRVITSTTAEAGGSSTATGTGTGASTSVSSTGGSGTRGSSGGSTSATSAGSGHASTSSAASSSTAGATVGATSSAGGGSSGASGGSTGRSDAGLPSAGCGLTGAQTGDFHLSTTDGNGTLRDYEVLVPTAYLPTLPLALAFVYHGAGGDEAQAIGFGLQNAPGAASAAIFVFPQGIDYQNDGVGWDDLCGGYDMVFFDHMLAALERSYCIDEARVDVAGFSWGCDQVTALACCRGDRLSAVGAASCTDEFASATSSRTYDNLPCPVAQGVPIRFTHDASGGDAAYPKPLFVTTSELYRSFNGCSNTSTAVTPSPCESYSGCTEPLVECPYPNLGHALPANWGADTWAFFSRF